PPYLGVVAHATSAPALVHAALGRLWPRVRAAVESVAAGRGALAPRRAALAAGAAAAAAGRSLLDLLRGEALVPPPLPRGFLRLGGYVQAGLLQVLADALTVGLLLRGHGRVLRHLLGVLRRFLQHGSGLVLQVVRSAAHGPVFPARRRCREPARQPEAEGDGSEGQRLLVHGRAEAALRTPRPMCGLVAGPTGHVACPVAHIACPAAHVARAFSHASAESRALVLRRAVVAV